MRLSTLTLASGLGWALLAAGGCSSSNESVEPSGKLSNGTHGPQKVAAGSTLESESEGGATVQSGESGAAILVETQKGKTTIVRNLKVDCRGGVGLLVKGDGSFVGERLALHCSKGIGIAAEGQSSFVLSKTTVVGTITKESVPNLAFPLAATQAPIVGMVLSNVASAKLEQVDIQGFGGFGAVTAGSTVEWGGGTIAGNVGVGLMQDGGMLTVSGLAITDTWAGQLGNAISSYAMVVARKGMLNSTSLTLQDNEGYGLVQDDARSVHSALLIKNNGDVGLWVQNASGTLSAPSLKIDGGDSRLEGNKGGGLFAVHSGGLELRGFTASEALEKPVASSPNGLTVMADGVQVADPTGDITVENATLLNNARVGLLLSGVLPAGASWNATAITVGGSGANGVIGQNGFPPVGYQNITYNTPVLYEKDMAFTGAMGTAMAWSSVVSSGLEAGLFGANGLISDAGDVTAVVDESGIAKGN